MLPHLNIYIYFAFAVPIYMQFLAHAVFLTLSELNYIVHARCTQKCTQNPLNTDMCGYSTDCK
jgi:hypothetical protein